MSEVNEWNRLNDNLSTVSLTELHYDIGYKLVGAWVHCQHAQNVGALRAKSWFSATAAAAENQTSIYL